MPEEELEQVASVEPTGEAVETVVEETAAEEPQEVAGDYTPDWLDEPAPEPPQQGPSPEEIAAYQRSMAMQHQQPPPQYAQPPPQQTDLDRLVQDTRGTISEIADQRAQAVAASVMQQQFNPYARQMEQFIQGQNMANDADSKRSVGKMYEVFNKDETFVGNEAVRNEVGKTLNGLRQQALQAASQGNRQGLDMLNDPILADITLYAAKKLAGAGVGAASPISAPHTEGAAPAVSTKKSYADQLDPDTIEGLKRTYGSHWESRYEKAEAEAEKYRD